MAKPSRLHPILHSARTRYKITTWDGLMVAYLENLKWGFRCHTIPRCQHSCRAKHCPKVGTVMETWYPCLHCLCVLYHLTGSIDKRYVCELTVYKISLNLMLLHYANTHSTHNTSMGMNVMIGVNNP